MTKSMKIPKKIGGVKLPKQARKTANKAIKMGAGPMVREIAVAAMGAGARARGKRKEPDEGLRHIQGSAHLHIDGARVGEAFRNAAIDGLRRFLEGFEEGLREISVSAEAEAGEPKPRTPKASRPGAG